MASCQQQVRARSLQDACSAPDTLDSHPRQTLCAIWNAGLLGPLVVLLLGSSLGLTGSKLCEPCPNAVTPPALLSGGDQPLPDFLSSPVHNEQLIMESSRSDDALQSMHVATVIICSMTDMEDRQVLSSRTFCAMMAKRSLPGDQGATAAGQRLGGTLDGAASQPGSGPSLAAGPGAGTAARLGPWEPPAVRSARRWPLFVLAVSLSLGSNCNAGETVMKQLRTLDCVADMRVHVEQYGATSQPAAAG